MSELQLTTTAARAGLAPARERRSRSARVLRALAVLLVLAGGLALLDAVVTLLWQEPISALYREHLARTA